MVTIKKIRPGRWREYRALRLEALKMEPLAFVASPERELALPQKEWRARTKNALFAEDRGALIGMLILVPETIPKMSHIVNLFSVYVRKEYRGRGIGEKLVKAALRVASSGKSVSKLKLQVNKTQKSAMRLYKRCGFRVVGPLKNELKIDGKFYDELLMEKMV